MATKGIFQENTFVLTERFRKLFIGTQFTAIGGLLNLFFLGEKFTDPDHTFYFRFDFIVLMVGFITTMFFLRLLGRGYDRSVFTTFLWLWTIVLVIMTWYEGALYSSLIISFPIILVFAVVFSERHVFLSLAIFLSVIVTFMGLSDITGWAHPPEGMHLDKHSRAISTILLIMLAGYATWVFGHLLKSSFHELRLENKRVKESQAVIKTLAGRDTATKLLNRSGADSAYKTLLKKLDVKREFVAAYFIDLDNFKNINDLYDHHTGDQLLVAISRRLESLCSKEDIVCRFGGDEFVLILKVKNGFEVEEFAEKITAFLRKPHFILGTEAAVTSSVGVVVVADKQLSFAAICKKADVAMLHAKKLGKNQYHLHSADLEREYMRNLNVVNSMDGALCKNLIDLYFQPKINLETNQIDGAEALLRWTRGNPNNIGPAEFMPIVESTELIHSIGAWVINQACDACSEWRRMGRSIKVAVNVSALQLTRPDFYQVVADALERNKLPPELLEIEITEHLLIAEAPTVVKQLAALKDLGVTLAIDDFGTGYSNIAYLTQLRVDVLKLDRSFISGIDQSEEHNIIVSSVITMAKAFGIKVVAEGIESIAELNILRGLDCDYGQGFLWSKAVSVSEFARVVDDFEAAA